MSDIQDLIQTIENEAINFFNGLEQVRANEVGLDSRCGRIMIGDDFVATEDARALDYYGGFEYVDKEQTKIMGDYKVYFSEDENDRVGKVIARWKEKEEAEKVEEEAEDDAFEKAEAEVPRVSAESLGVVDEAKARDNEVVGS